MRKNNSGVPQKPSCLKPSSTPSSSSSVHGCCGGPAELQVVELVLADGRRAMFSGPAVFRSEQDRVVKIRFFEPKPLPAGMEFVKIDDLEQAK